MPKKVNWIAGALLMVTICLLAVWAWTTLVERSVIRDADRRSEEWTIYAADRLERIETLADGADPTANEWTVIEELATFGGVFRFKVFSPEGVLQFVSDDPTASGSDLGEHNATAAGVVATGRPFTVVADGTAKPDRPEMYSETYLPVRRGDEKVAIMEVYFDQTEKAQQVRAEYATFGLILLALFVLAISLPAGAVAILVRRLRQRNVELDAERRKALAADVAKSEFLSTISHELRTPMNGIIGVVQLLETSELSEDDRELFEVLSTCSEAQMVLIEEILAFGEVEAGAIRIAEEPVAPNELMRTATAVAVMKANEKGLVCDVVAADDLPDFLGDTNRLRQVIANLAGNAVKFTEHGSVEICADIAIGSDHRHGTLQITVADTGQGIADSDQARIFERFTQVDNSLTRKVGGTGLGLAIARAIAHEMGGEIYLESTLGQGSTFTFSMPIELVEVQEVPGAEIQGQAA